MAQTTVKPDTIQQKVEQLSEKAARARELHQEVQDIKRKRETAKHKNNSFRDLNSKIGEVREQYQQLEIWIAYAERMGLSIPEGEIRKQREAVERDVRSLREQSWDGFEEADDVNDKVKSFESHRTSFRDLTDEVRESVQNEVEDELEPIDRIFTLLQIPDIGDEETERICRNYEYFLKKLKEGEPRDDVSPEKWKQHHELFQSLDIDLGDDLTDAAKDVIWSLLRDETVTLAEIDEAVLDDLKTFEEFSKRLSIQFTTS